jgi:acyl-CoA dehydrogenase
MNSLKIGKDSSLGSADDSATVDDNAGLRELIAELGQRSFDRLTGGRSRPAQFDVELWGNLEETGLSRLMTTAELEAGPASVALLLTGLARNACPVPVAETDLLAVWLAAETGLHVPESGPLTIGFGTVEFAREASTFVVNDVPWSKNSAAVVVVLESVERGRMVAVIDPSAHKVTGGDNLAAEPRDQMAGTLDLVSLRALSDGTYRELLVRGAWARCTQVIGSLQAAVALTIAHTREREQFGRSLSTFQSVQHELTGISGSLERGIAATELAIAAAEDFGFAAEETNFAVAVAKVTLGQCVEEIVNGAHQLHGAIGVTAEHSLWLHTMRARSAIGEFRPPRWWAEQLGRQVIASADPWDTLIGAVDPGSKSNEKRGSNA